jgi:hypothetical protein
VIVALLFGLWWVLLIVCAPVYIAACLLVMAVAGLRKGGKP